MEMHVQTAHAQPRVTANAGNKAPKLPRPTLAEEISEGDWNFFLEQWKRYKRATNLSVEDVTDELWACLSDELARQCFDHGANMTTTTEKDLLALLKAQSIKAQNRLVNIVEYLNLKQKENENITKFIARVRGCANVCNFSVKCTAAGCNTKVSYADQLSSHVIVRGLENPDIQEKVLALAATEDKDLSLQKITEFVLAQETAVQSRRILNEEDPSVYKLSQYKKDMRRRSNTLPNASGLKCQYCGQTGHGKMAGLEDRKNVCPAYGKQCTNCKIWNHVASQCQNPRQQQKSPPHEGEAAALQAGDRSSSSSSESGNFGFIGTLATEERSSSSSSSQADHYDADSDRSSGGEEFGWFSMNMVNNKSQKIKKKLNFGTVAHHEADPRGKWTKSCVEPQPEVTVEVSICSDSSYNQIGVRRPRSQHSVTCQSVPDTGSQIVVGGLNLLRSLGMSRIELFPVSSKIKTANKKGLELLGGILVNITAAGASGHTRTGKYMVYISSEVDSLFLSRAACRDLGIIGPNFPEIAEDHNSQRVLQQMQETTGATLMTPPDPGHGLEFGDGVSNILWALSLLAEPSHQLQLLPPPGDNRV